jgi:hypothetical protein
MSRVSKLSAPVGAAGGQMAKGTQEPKDTREGPRSFTRFFDDIGEGDFQRDAAEKLFELVSALRDEAIYCNGKVKGKFALTLDFSIDPRGVVAVDCDSKIKKPTRKRAPAQAWITAGGNLTLEHPRQLKLPVREVKNDNHSDAREMDGDERSPAREV